MSVTEAKSQLSALVEDAIRGKETIITKHGKPVARIVPITKPRIVFGLLEGKLPEFDDLDPSEPWLRYSIHPKNNGFSRGARATGLLSNNAC